MTVSIEIMHEGVINLLSEMERLKLIRINIPAENTAPPPVKLSERFAGSLKLSDAGYKAFQNSLTEGRNEWNRNIY
jgi:hypothetical protein